MAKNLNKSMTEGPLFKNIVLYTLPIILTSLLQLLFNAADLVVVGRFRGSVSVAAVGATGSITMLIVNLFIGLSVGMGASLTPMIISVLGVCGIRVGWIFTVFQIPKFHTPACLYFSYTVSWIVTFAIQMIAFVIIYNKRKKEELL